jgi:hypothetical protein
MSRSRPPSLPGLTATARRGSGCPARWARCTAAVTASSAARPLSSSARPAGVSDTSRVVRSSNRTPRRDSSWEIAFDSGGWAIPSRCAAREKFSSSATAAKYRSSRTSTSLISAEYKSRRGRSFPDRRCPG